MYRWYECEKQAEERNAVNWLVICLCKIILIGSANSAYVVETPPEIYHSLLLLSEVISAIRGKK